MRIHNVDGVDLVAPATVALANEKQGFATSALLGQAESIPVVVDDPLGVLSFTGHKKWTTRETTAPAGNQVIWVGFVGEKVISRAADVVYPQGRVWDITLVEASTIVVRRILRTSEGAKRPSETVSARIAWVLTTSGFSGIVVDDGLVASSSHLMDEHDYGVGGQTGIMVLNECAAEIGWNWAIRYREATDDFELLFFDFRTSSLDASTLLVSNLEADFNWTTCFPANDGAKIHQIPTNVAPGVELAYNGGLVYTGMDAGLAAAFAPIDQSAPSSWVKLASTAQTLAERYQAQHSTEEEKVTDLEILVPASSVNIVKAGQLIQAKFTHGPGWESFRYARVVRKVVKPPENNDQENVVLGLDLEPAEPLFPVASEAYAHSPTDRAYDPPALGAFRIFWASDHPGCDPGSPFATGNLSLVVTLGDVTGFQADGSGTLTVHSHGTMAGASAGTFTFTASVRVNGVAVLSDSVEIDNSGGIGPLNFTWDIDGSFHVEAGDIVETWFDVAGDRVPSILVIPAGSGDCANYFDAIGDLAA